MKRRERTDETLSRARNMDAAEGEQRQKMTATQRENYLLWKKKGNTNFMWKIREREANAKQVCFHFLSFNVHTRVHSSTKFKYLSAVVVVDFFLNSKVHVLHDSCTILFDFVFRLVCRLFHRIGAVLKSRKFQMVAIDSAFAFHLNSEFEKICFLFFFSVSLSQSWFVRAKLL